MKKGYFYDMTVHEKFCCARVEGLFYRRTDAMKTNDR